MGLAKLVVDVQSLTTILLEEPSDRVRKLSNTEHLPSDSVVFQAKIQDGKLYITLSHTDLPELTFGQELLESDMEVEIFETTPAQQLRLDRYEIELQNMIHLQTISSRLTLPQFNNELTKLSTRVLSVLRHEDPDEVLRIAGQSAMFTDIKDEKTDESKS